MVSWTIIWRYLLCMVLCVYCVCQQQFKEMRLTTAWNAGLQIRQAAGVVDRHDVLCRFSVTHVTTGSTCCVRPTSVRPLTINSTTVVTAAAMDTCRPVIRHLRRRSADNCRRNGHMYFCGIFVTCTLSRFLSAFWIVMKVDLFEFKSVEQFFGMVVSALSSHSILACHVFCYLWCTRKWRVFNS